MRRNWLMESWMVPALLLGLTLLGGCNSQQLKDENALLTEENQGLRDQLSDRNVELETTQGELRDEQTRTAELKRQLEENWQDPAPAANTAVAIEANDPFAGIAGVSGSYRAGEVTATVESDVLFSSGKATLRASAKRSLDAVARVLKSEYGGKMIRVAGHTDTDPIRKSGFKSNHHLGFERAFAVRTYLASRGVSEENLYIASHGPDKSLGSKKESRRVEIAVVLNEG
ncbi:MAG: OmpA family protein [Planctomycetes bacterium]|nr:OmpA family protein [Planctomycetota bacterium]